MKRVFIFGAAVFLAHPLSARTLFFDRASRDQDSATAQSVPNTDAMYSSFVAAPQQQDAASFLSGVTPATAFAPLTKINDVNKEKARLEKAARTALLGELKKRSQEDAFKAYEDAYEKSKKAQQKQVEARSAYDDGYRAYLKKDPAGARELKKLESLPGQQMNFQSRLKAAGLFSEWERKNKLNEQLAAAEKTRVATWTALSLEAREYVQSYESKKSEISKAYTKKMKSLNAPENTYRE